MRTTHDINGASHSGVVGKTQRGSALLLCGLAGVLLALCLFTTASYADDGAGVSAETKVTLSAGSLEPLVLVSQTGNGEDLSVISGGSLSLTAEFTGGEGKIAYTWEVSYDGGALFGLLSETSNTYTITDAKAPDCGFLVYRIYAYDESVQRVPAMFKVYVTAASPESPRPTPPPVLPGSGTTRPASYAGNGGLSKTGDSIALGILVVAAGTAGLTLHLVRHKKGGDRNEG